MYVEVMVCTIGVATARAPKRHADRYRSHRAGASFETGRASVFALVVLLLVVLLEIGVERVGRWAAALPVVSLGAGRRGIGSASDVPNVFAGITAGLIPRVGGCSGALVRAKGISHVVVVSELVPRFGLSLNVLRIAHSVFPFHHLPPVWFNGGHRKKRADFRANDLRAAREDPH